MIPVDLVTGFLGAGKTSFLLRYARFLLGKGQRLGILVYDHGAVNVDLPLLGTLRSERCEVETLASACGGDCHRRRFRSRLIAMAMSGYDRILIEPSGVFDMDEFYDTLREEPLESWLEIGNVICVLDARLPEDLLPEEDFFLASQAACAGRVVLSRVQLASWQEIENTLRHLDRAADAIRAAEKPSGRTLARDWDALGADDFADLSRCGFFFPDYVKTVAGGETGFQSLSFLNLPLGGSELRKKAAALFHGCRYARILRVKGFFRENGRWLALNATRHACELRPAAESLGVLTVIGRELDERAIHLLLTGEEPTLHIL